ncbi:PQQ-dependent sugar dehydrogenase [Paludisphaera rhizosphaerae]|uniref:PQQ-dependent sugar dehydrogenase n=1 Tax=Paludisphaera rhizosphaerae TaxID=2711216 RepID=UPI0013ED2E2D|nr:PQQ-dependent sugar dehydrogenase [Paludisphaera rhizosphaerae]
MPKLIGTEITTTLSRPVFLTAPPGDEDRLFVVEQTGSIRIIRRSTGKVVDRPFLTIAGLSGGGERGLLGLAFHPDYATNGFFYVNCTVVGGATSLRRYTVSSDPDVADPASILPLLGSPQPFPNHNGGWLGFGPDGFLYAALGDGGSGNDPGNRAQNKGELLGKMLRLDVNGDDFPGDSDRNYAIPTSNPFVNTAGARGEIWAYGLRNPWRNSFDRKTGDLYIGDVGQDQREELNFQKAGAAGGVNYGWRPKEGTKRTPGVGDPVPSDAVDPFFEYTHNDGVAIIGGYVYRGEAISGLEGTYFFADTTGPIWSLKFDGATVAEHTERTDEILPGGTISGISSFGEDAVGELYLLTLDGRVVRIDSAP